MLACVCLHNYLRLTENACYSPNGFVDSEDNNGAIKAGDCQKLLPTMMELSDHSKAKEGGTAVKPTLSVRHLCSIF